MGLQFRAKRLRAAYRNFVNAVQIVVDFVERAEVPEQRRRRLLADARHTRDVVDAVTGERQEGIIFSARSFAFKAGGAVASVIAVFPGLCNNFLSVAMLYGLVLMPMGAVIFADHPDAAGPGLASAQEPVPFHEIAVAVPQGAGEGT